MIARIAAALLMSTSVAAPAQVPVPLETVLAAEPGAKAIAQPLLRIEGSYIAGGAPGSFVEVIAPASGKFHRTVRSGPLSEQTGFDGAPWVRHDGILVAIDHPGAVADARAQDFLARFGWRDRASRRFLHAAGRRRADDGTNADVLTVSLPGASPIALWFGADDHQLFRAVIDADAGPFTIAYSDWRTVSGGARMAFRREERDVTGQTTVFAARQVTPLRRGEATIARPADTPHGRVAAGARSIPFVFDHGDRGHIVVPATIDARPAQLVFDTGAANYLTPAVAADYGLKVSGGVNIGGAGEGSFAGGFARIGRIAIGAATLSDSIAMVAPLPDAATHPRAGLVLQGLTGFEFLSEFRTTIDYGRRTIDVTGFDEPAPRVPFMPFVTDGYAIFVTASVEGHRGWFRLDTGDGGGVTLFRRFAQTNGLVGGERRSVGGEAGGAVSSRVRDFATVEIAGVSLKDVPGEISEQSAGAFESRVIAGNIGAAVLSKFRVVIDFRAKRLALIPLDPGTAAPR